jgi:hypothetical protein
MPSAISGQLSDADPDTKHLNSERRDHMNLKRAWNLQLSLPNNDPLNTTHGYPNIQQSHPDAISITKHLDSIQFNSDSTEAVDLEFALPIRARDHLALHRPR